MSDDLDVFSRELACRVVRNIPLGIFLGRELHGPRRNRSRGINTVEPVIETRRAIGESPAKMVARQYYCGESPLECTVKVANMGIVNLQLVAGMHGLEISLSPHVVDKVLHRHIPPLRPPCHKRVPPLLEIHSRSREQFGLQTLKATSQGSANSYRLWGLRLLLRAQDLVS